MLPEKSLSLRPVVFFLALFFAAFIPAAYWLGLNQPVNFDLRGEPYPVLWAQCASLFVGFLLFVVPLLWILFARIIDVLALAFCLNALLIWSYFIFPESAQQLYHAEAAIFAASAQVMGIATVGFLLMLAAMLGWYGLLAVQQRRLPPLPASPEEMDRRLRWVLYPALLVVTAMVAAPIALTGAIPLLSSDPVAARLALEQSTVGRPLYNLGSSLLPTLVAATLILSLRRKHFLLKIFNPAVILALMACGVQFLTSNRQPLAITGMTFFALFSMERKLPRFLLPLAVIVFFVGFTGVGGYFGILRQHRELLEEGNIVVNSFEEAFLGDNLADVRDGAWVIGEWNFQPLDGLTYLGGLASVVPSAFFPEKEQWHLGKVSLRIVNQPAEEHFGLRLGFFDEAFLNFGLAGVIGLAVLLGSWFGVALRWLHLSARTVPCLTRNLRVTLSLQLAITLCNTGSGFVIWSLAFLLLVIWIGVELPLRLWRPGKRVAFSSRQEAA